MRLKVESKLKIVRVYLGIVGVFLLFWWPLSHWFYSDFYHTLLGFKLGSYQNSMVLVIGACGVVPVMLSLMAANDPVRNRDGVAIIIFFSIVMALTYAYLIRKDLFPMMEIVNIALTLFSAAFLTVFFPWRHAYGGAPKG